MGVTGRAGANASFLLYMCEKPAHLHARDA